MTRIDGWEDALYGAIEAAAKRPFEWGAHDCTMAAADVVAAVTGVDPMAEFRGRYTSSRGAAKLINSLGLADLHECVSLRFEEVPIGFAQRGDVVAVKENGRLSLGVCLGARSAFASVTGWDYRPTLDCLHAWRT